jgi:hypothetical protein
VTPSTPVSWRRWTKLRSRVGNLAEAGNTVILRSNLADIAGIVASLTQVFGKAAAK